MAEGLGIAASIVSLASIANGIIKIIKSLQNAPDEILALSNEACDLYLVVSELQVLQQDTRHPRPWTHNLGKMMLAVQLKVRELEDFIQHISTLNIKDRSFDRVRWVFEKRKAKAIQDGLRKVRQDLMTVLTSANTSSSFRVELAMNEILFTRDREPQTQPSLLDELAPHKMAIARLWGEQEKATESLRQILEILAPTSRIESDPTARRFAKTKRNRLSHVEFQFSSLTKGRLQCSQACGCSCHHTKTFESPRFTHMILGTLFANYSAFPSGGKKCSSAQCSAQAPTLKVVYYFPSWLLHRVVCFIYMNSFCGPSFGLTVRRVVPVNSNLFTSVAGGHIGRVLGLFETRTSTPNDIHSISGETPLHFAIKYGQLKMCKALISAGADIYLEDRRQRAPVDVAWAEIVANAKDTETLEGFRTLFEDRDHFELRRPQKLHQALLGISKQDPYSVLEDALIEDINAKDEEGKTALAWAVLKGDFDFVEALLNEGADPDVCDNNQDSPLALCTHGTTPEIMELLISRGASFTVNLRRYNPLHKAAFRQNNAKYLSPFINSKIHLEIDSLADGNETPLGLATLRDHHLAVAFLLDNGAKIDSVDDTGVTPLFDAIKYHSHKVLEVLIKKGADISFRSRHGTTILHHLAEWGSCEAIQILRAHGMCEVDVDIRNDKGLTATEVAERRKSSPEGFFNDFIALVAAVKFATLVEVGSEKSYDSVMDAYMDCVETIV